MHRILLSSQRKYHPHHHHQPIQFLNRSTPPLQPLKTSTPSRPFFLRMNNNTGAAETDSQAAEVANTSGISPESLTATLKEKLDAQHVDINDMSGGCGQAFEAVIVSPQFDKKTTLARHRLVNAALKQEIAAIHAWTPKCLTPEEWERKKAGAA